MLTMTRRETLFGAAGAATAAALPQTVLAAPLGPRRPRLWPIGALQIDDSRYHGGLMMNGRWHRYALPSAAQPPSQEQQAMAVLNVYRALVNDVVIQGADLDNLGPEKRAELIAIDRQFSPSSPRRHDHVGHGQAVCRWLDHEVSKIVTNDWRVIPSERAASIRAYLMAQGSRLVA